MDTEGKLTFNHAMIYVKDVDRGLRFYRDLLGFKLMITISNSLEGDGESFLRSSCVLFHHCHCSVCACLPPKVLDGTADSAF
jgi:hypothetical protein